MFKMCCTCSRRSRGNIECCIAINSSTLMENLTKQLRNLSREWDSYYICIKPYVYYVLGMHAFLFFFAADSLIITVISYNFLFCRFINKGGNKENQKAQQESHEWGGWKTSNGFKKAIWASWMSCVHHDNVPAYISGLLLLFFSRWNDSYR